MSRNTIEVQSSPTAPECSGQDPTRRQDETLRQLFLQVAPPAQTLFEQTRFEKALQARLEQRSAPRALRPVLAGGLSLGVVLAVLLVWWSQSALTLLPEGEGAAVAVQSSSEEDGYPRWLALTADAESILAPTDDGLGIDDSSLYARASQETSGTKTVASAAGKAADLTEQSNDTSGSVSEQNPQVIALAKVMTEDVLELDSEEEYLPADYQALDGIWASSL